MQRYKECLKNDETILKCQKRFRSVFYVFTKNVNKTKLSANDDKRIKAFGGIVSYPCGAYSAGLGEVSKAEFTRHSKNIKLSIMISFNEATGESTKENSLHLN